MKNYAFFITDCLLARVKTKLWWRLHWCLQHHTGAIIIAAPLEEAWKQRKSTNKGNVMSEVGSTHSV